MKFSGVLSMALLLSGSAITNACTGSNSCTGNTGAINTGACEGAHGGNCNSNSGVIVNSGCTGEDNCEGNSGDINGGCIGVSTCDNNSGEIDGNSCMGNNACDNNSAIIASSACEGQDACRDRGDNAGAIGKGACLGDRACCGNPAPIAAGTCLGADACSLCPPNKKRGRTPGPVIPPTLSPTSSPTSSGTKGYGRTPGPVAPTLAPVEPTLAPTSAPTGYGRTPGPIVPTRAPVDPTPAPVSPTMAPVNPTRAPVNPTRAPVNPTRSPVSPTRAPVSPTRAPVSPTRAPVNPTRAPVNPTQAPIEPPIASGCPDYLLDFNDLDAATYVFDELHWSHGVSITAIADGSLGHTPQPNNKHAHIASGGSAYLFDSSRPHGDAAYECNGLPWGNAGDTDLGTPNQNCGGGPGVGSGGTSGSPYENCNALGNLLIIQERDQVCPDDSATGGSFDFDFRSKTTLKEITLVDTEEAALPVITVTFESGSTETFVTTASGNNGVVVQSINRDNVVSARVHLPGSGAIASLKYTFCTPDTCDLTYMDFDQFSRGDFLHDQLWDSNALKITAKKRMGYTQGYTPINGVHQNSGGAAMVFDTSNPLCPSSSSNDGDSDLGSPNSECAIPGPGKDHGDHWGGGPTNNGEPNPYQNCEPLGNVLVIQESADACPDDSATGGYIQFNFKYPAYVQSLTILDIDDNAQGVNIKTRTMDGVETNWYTGTTGNNGVWRESILMDNLEWILVYFNGSGSVAEIDYAACE